MLILKICHDVFEIKLCFATRMNCFLTACKRKGFCRKKGKRCKFVIGNINPPDLPILFPKKPIAWGNLYAIAVLHANLIWDENSPRILAHVVPRLELGAFVGVPARLPGLP
jgi:hypothetical protein